VFSFFVLFQSVIQLDAIDCVAPASRKNKDDHVGGLRGNGAGSCSLLSAAERPVVRCHMFGLEEREDCLTWQPRAACFADCQPGASGHRLNGLGRAVG